MFASRFDHRTHLWVLAAFVLALLSASAAPLLKRGEVQALQAICSAAGHQKSSASAGGFEGSLPAEAHGADCALCLPGSAPPPQAAGFKPCSTEACAAPIAAIASIESRPLRAAWARGPPSSPYPTTTR